METGYAIQDRDLSIRQGILENLATLSTVGGSFNFCKILGATSHHHYPYRPYRPNPGVDRMMTPASDQSLPKVEPTPNPTHGKTLLSQPFDAQDSTLIQGSAIAPYPVITSARPDGSPGPTLSGVPDSSGHSRKVVLSS